MLYDSVMLKNPECTNMSSLAENGLNKERFEEISLYFKYIGHFSKNTPVPSFGNEKSNKAEVDNFYKFFSNFESKKQ